MEKEQPVPSGDVVHYLKQAALFPQLRGEMISRALQAFLACFPAVGAALVWPDQERKIPWKIYYAGIRSESMRRWLSGRLDPSLDTMLGMLQQDLSRIVEMPAHHLICLQAPGSFSGLWIVWTTFTPLTRPASQCLEEVRQVLCALLEVEGLEKQYFSPHSPVYDRAVTGALTQGDAQALSTVLSLTRLVGNASFTFWGQVYQKEVEVSTHLGATEHGFGFVLPRGHGVGGRIAAYGTPIVVVEDYLNSPYRDSSVTGIIDSEQIRSSFALPVCTAAQSGGRAEVAAILYVTRRTVTPFTLAELLLVQRLAHELEPLPQARRSPVFPSVSLPQFSDQKAAWYHLVLHARHIESLEAWISQFIKGTVIVVDSDGNPYVAARSEELERLRSELDESIDPVQVLSLAIPDGPLAGKVYLRSSILLPPPQWPDFFADLVMACNLIISRMEKTHDQLARQREHWIHALLREPSLRQTNRDGYHLGLPIEQGQIMVIAWPIQSMSATQATRKRMLAESIVLDHLKSPLIFFGDDIGIVLLDEGRELHPSRLRDALLKQPAAHPLWIVYGTRYSSLDGLKSELTHALSLAQKARREGRDTYLLDIRTPGLDNLLQNPRLTEELHNFAARLFAPLLEHDTTKGTDLTQTFVLAQTLGSAQVVADQLAVHVNTIRYRLHKAEELLGGEPASPKERTAWALAAFIWQSYQE